MLGKAVQRWRIAGKQILSDKTRSGRPVAASDHLNQDLFEDFVELVIL